MSTLLTQVEALFGPQWAESLDRYGWMVLLGLAVLTALFALQAVRRNRRATRALLELSERRAEAATEAQFAEIKGRLAAMAEMTAQRHADQSRGLNERLDEMATRLGTAIETFGRRIDVNLAETGKQTFDNLSNLNERLAVIDDARRNLADLASEVVSLQGVLSNKQARGAFGQVRMETIIRDALPASAYEFQPTLSNGRRPDCLVRLPGQAPLVIDSKFPLEGFEALRIARAPDETKAALSAVREAVGRHIDDIAGKYLIPGETQDTALMFVPSESVYADLHERLPDLLQKAYRQRVVIVAPNILMLAVQTIQAVIRDVKMRDQAGVIQREVGALLADVGRLVDRASELDRHFTQAVKALETVTGSAERIARRGERLRSLELESDEPVTEPARLSPRPARSQA
ncbi:MAG: DNA recombination protein RmuC [Hyphomicrobiaceae bacterium]